MSASDDFITSDDIVGYLEERSPSEMEDDELEHLYEMIDLHYSKSLSCPQEYAEDHFTMARYFLEQAWLVEGEVNKDGY